MLKDYAIFVEGLKDLGNLDSLEEDINNYARETINDTVRYGRAIAARQMEKETAFPRGYLTGENGRLSVARYASNNKLEGVIRGRDRPTSLARFVVGSPKLNKRGVNVVVAPGVQKKLEGAFLIKLRNNNLGLAVRSKSAPRTAHKPKQLGSGLWLLYGPSVDQVFREIRTGLVPDLESYMQQTFEQKFEKRRVK
jgi:hypothetical protein